MAKEQNEEIKNCGCSEECDCTDQCKCTDEHKCSESCKCEHDHKECHKKHDKNCCKHEECDCDENCDCEHEECEHECGCEHDNDKSEEYLNLARQIQADFENFRRRTIEDLKQARFSGQASVIEAFLPCLDTFKEAKKSISDAEVLKGVEMIENKINEALKQIGVEKIISIGEKYNPHLHNAIAVRKDDSKENDIILEEYQAGYKFNDKVIRYAIVSVNKKED